MRYELLDTTRRTLDRMAVEAQRASRTPALAAGVAHRGDLLWSAGVGTADLADPSVPLGVDTQFLIASNTKTFTAVMVLQLRDEGRLRLDDQVDDLLPGSAHPGVTVRQLLAHASGMQREPVDRGVLGLARGAADGALRRGLEREGAGARAAHRLALQQPRLPRARRDRGAPRRPVRGRRA